MVSILSHRVHYRWGTLPGMKTMSAMITLFLLLGPAYFFVAFDLRRMKWEQEQEQRCVWYQRPRMLLGIAEILWSLRVSMQLDMITLTLPHVLLSIMKILFSLLLFVLVVTILIIVILRNRNNKYKLAPAASITRQRLAPRIESAELVDTREALVAAICVLVLFSILLGSVQLIEYFPSAPYTPFLDGWSLLFVGLGLVCCMVLVARADVRLHFFQSIERRRAALAAERSFPSITIEQASQELTFPFVPTITLHLKGTHLSFWLVVMLGLAVPGWVSLLQPHISYHIPVATTFFAQSIPLLVLHLVLLLNNRKMVQVTNDDLKTVRTEKITTKEQHIAWSEAHLFVCYRFPSLFLGRKTIIYYELSGPGKIVTWMWVLDPQSPFTLWKPLIPPGKYHQQMQALCGLVTARTGLELHDLSLS